jgi:hypothetical protein
VNIHHPSPLLDTIKHILIIKMSQHQATCDGGTCFGDSGGPAFWTEPSGSEILVGISSWGDAQCAATGYNDRVDIPDTLDFVHDVIADLG